MFIFIGNAERSVKKAVLRIKNETDNCYDSHVGCLLGGTRISELKMLVEFRLINERHVA